MTRNVGGTERTVRAMAAGALVAFGWSRRGTLGTLALEVAMVEMATVLTRYCPVNQALGRSSYNPGREPTSRNRVARNTPAVLNARLSREMRQQVEETLPWGPQQVDRRLEELDREWDLERVLEVDAAVGALIGVGVGLTRDERFLALPALAAGACIIHALQGWYPMLSLFRGLGFRTTEEIMAERNLLKAGRGDYANLADRPEELLAAVRA